MRESARKKSIAIRERKRNRNNTIGIWDIFALIAEEKWEAMV